MNIKSELQGVKGLLNKLRDSHMPSGNIIAHEAIKKLGYTASRITKDEVRNGFNTLLFNALIEEWKVFQKYEKEFYKSKIIPSIFELIEKRKKEFPICQSLIKNIKTAIVKKNRIKDSEWLIAFLSKSLFEYYEALFQSLHQSRRSRAGGSFQYQIENLFNLAGFPFAKQTRLNGPVDFLLPSENYFSQYRHDAIILSVKRTLRERWQQAIAELQAARVGRIYLATAEIDKNKIRERDLDRMDSLNVTLVVFDNIKMEKFQKRNTVIGYSEFINTNVLSAESLWIRRGVSSLR
ncbi:MAG: hypothetical protein HZB81_07675 [Deltaproteobacteria bacterium]|nr:hypothetical protein [Deltaproteobacteria bacterium]